MSKFNLDGWDAPASCFADSDLNIPYLVEMGLVFAESSADDVQPQIPRTPKNLRGGGRMRCWRMPEGTPKYGKGRPSDERFLTEYRTLNEFLPMLACGQVLCLSAATADEINRHIAATRRMAVWHGLTLEWEDKAQPEVVTVGVESGKRLSYRSRIVEHRVYARVIGKACVTLIAEQTTEIAA